MITICCQIALVMYTGSKWRIGVKPNIKITRETKLTLHQSCACPSPTLMPTLHLPCAALFPTLMPTLHLPCSALSPTLMPTLHLPCAALFPTLIPTLHLSCAALFPTLMPTLHLACAALFPNLMPTLYWSCAALFPTLMPTLHLPCAALFPTLIPTLQLPCALCYLWCQHYHDYNWHMLQVVIVIWPPGVIVQVKRSRLDMLIVSTNLHPICLMSRSWPFCYPMNSVVSPIHHKHGNVKSRRECSSMLSVATPTLGPESCDFLDH